MKWFVAALAAALVPTAALACDEGMPKANIQNLSVQQVAELTKANKATVFDANSDETRLKNGIIPGAKLLTSSSKYDPAKELPAAKDAKLVFYCANEKCLASDKAAKRASEAGYTNVGVLKAGIKGWKDAGQPTTAPGGQS